MQAGPSPAREARHRHRLGVRTLTYVTLDQGNGGILLNVTRQGIAVQTVAATRSGQQVQVRFDLLAPRVRVRARGEIIWATASGRCGIRFLDLSTQTAHQLDEWTFAKLLEGASPLSHPEDSVLAAPRVKPWQSKDSAVVRRDDSEDEALDQEADSLEFDESTRASDDNLIISPRAVQAIDLPISSGQAQSPDALDAAVVRAHYDPDSEAAGRLDWLSQPLSGRKLAWTLNGLVVIAAWLLFILVVLFVLRDVPKWPVAMISGAAIVVAALYWGFFQIFAGASLGSKLAQLAQTQPHDDELEENRFR